jgi:hypothetical protein
MPDPEIRRDGAPGDDRRDWEQPQPTAEERAAIERHEALSGLLEGPATKDLGDPTRPPWLAGSPRLTSVPKRATQGEAIVVRGERLDGLEEATFDAIPARVLGFSDDGEEALLEVPETAAGMVSLWVNGARGQAYGPREIRVTMPDDADADEE